VTQIGQVGKIQARAAQSEPYIGKPPLVNPLHSAIALKLLTNFYHFQVISIYGETN